MNVLEIHINKVRHINCRSGSHIEAKFKSVTFVVLNQHTDQLVVKTVEIVFLRKMHYGLSHVTMAHLISYNRI